MNNRLQFIHHNEIFETREEAYLYLWRMQTIDRPSLFAEPMIMRYKNPEHEKSPYIILAIGSVGDGTTHSNDNRVFIIDTQKTQEEIGDLDKKFVAITDSITMYEKDTNTLNVTIERNETGTTIAGDVILSDYEIFDKKQRDSILMATEKGLFTFVDLKYNAEENSFTFFLNDRVEKFQLPKEQFIESGIYDIKTEEIKLYYNTDKLHENPISIDVNNLIEEWETEAEHSNTPIVLTRERIKNEEDGHKFRDVLKGDVRVAKTKANILEKTEDGKALFVKGVADNIAYKGSTVESTLDQLVKDVVVATDSSNIVVRRDDGLYAEVDLKYEPTTNTLKFKSTKMDDYRDIKLNGVDIFTAIWYDANEEMLNLQWKDSNGDLQVVKIEISNMFEEWQVNNVEHSVKLEKIRSKAGHTLLTGDVKISHLENNILQDINHELYVNGISENIKYGENSTVRAELDQLNERMDEKDEQIAFISGTVDSVIERLDETNDALEEEIKTRKEQVNALSGAIDTNRADIDRLDETVGTGFTRDPHENITFKFEQEVATRVANVTFLSGAVDTTNEKLDNEIETRRELTDSLSESVDILSDKIGTGFTSDSHTNVTAKFEKEIQDRIDGDKKIQDALDELSGKSVNFVTDTDSIHMSKEGDVISSNIKISGKEDNLIEVVKDNLGDGIYSAVDVTYDGVTNVLTLVTNKGTKDIQLVGVTAFEKIKYEPITESIVIKATGIEEEIRIPVGEILQEWVVLNQPESPIVLTLSSHVIDGKDSLSADVRISVKEDNILKNVDGALYVSNVDIANNASEINTIKATIGDKFGVENNQTITYFFNKEEEERKSEVARLDNELSNTLDTLNDEIATRTEQVNALSGAIDTNSSNIDTINATVGTGFTTDAHETITYKFTQEESERKIEDIRLQDEIDKTNQAVSDLDVKHNTDIFGINSRLTTTEEDVAIISKKLGDDFSTNETETVTYKFNKETEERISEDNKLKEAINELGSTSVLSVDDSNTVQFVKNGTVLTANAKIASESGNILQAKVDGLYTSVDVSYDKNTNELVTSINGETKKTRINGVLNIATPVYDSATESLTINFVKTDGTNDKVVVNLSDLANSFEIKNETSSAVKLQLSEHKVDGKDILSANVDIVSQDVHPDNILVNDGGALYVSNSNIVSNANEIKAINEKIGNSFSKNNTISDAVIRIENELASSTGDLNDDIDKLKKSDEAQSANIDANADAIATINGKLGDTFTSANTVSKAIADLDTLIGQSVENLANADNALNERINAEKIDVNAKIEALKTADADIKTLISEQVNSLNAKDAEIVGQINAESTRARSEEEKIMSVVVEFKDSIERSIGGVQANLTSESDRAKEEETKLSTAITSLVTSTGNDHEALLTETNARKQDRRELEVLIEKSKPTVEDTQTIDLTLTDANVIKGEVLISNSEENIIKASRSDERGSGLYATVNLGYDAAKNTLIFSASGKGEKEIQLNAGSIIDGIDYDSNTKELAIRYRSTSGGDQLQTRVEVKDLINDWDVEGVDDEGNYSGAIALHKVRLENGSYKLSGRVQVSTLPSNLLVNDNGNLYVDGTKVGETKDLVTQVSGVVDTLKEGYSETKEKIGNIINGVRLTNEGNFDTSLLVGTNYISGATNVMEALRMMDAALKAKIEEVNKMLETVLQGSDTYSINLEKGSGTGEYDMKMYGNLRLAKSKFGGEQTEVEYSDAEMQDRGNLTNLLKVIHQENNETTSSSNGLFYDGSVDYGMFDSNGNLYYPKDNETN